MIVQAPDNKTIDFGDLPPDQVTAAMQKLYPPQASTFSDVAKSAGTGLAQGAIGLVTGPIDLGAKGGAWLANKAGRAIVGDSYMPQEGPPSLTDTVNNALGFNYQSQTTPGKYANTISSFVPAVAALTEGNGAPLSKIAQKVLGTSVLAGSGSEALGEATEGTAMEPYARAAGALLGDRVLPSLGTSVAKGASDIKTGLMARSPEVLQDASQSMKSGAGSLYNQMRDAGAVFNQDKTSDLLKNIDTAIDQKQFIPELNPKTTAIVNHLKKAAESGELGLSDLDQYRRLLSRVGSTEDGVSAGSVRKAIDEAVNSASETDLVKGGTGAIDLLNKGRAEYAKASAFEDISEILSKAEGDPNKIKSGLTRFLNKPENTRGWTDEEINALKNAARTGAGEYILKGLGRFGFEPKNIFMPLVGGATATTLFGGPVGAGLAAAGTAARQGQKYIARGKGENLLKTIENRGAATKQIPLQPQPTMNLGVPSITIHPKEYYDRMMGR